MPHRDDFRIHCPYVADVGGLVLLCGPVSPPEQARTRTLLSTILATIVAIIDHVRNFHIHQPCKRDRADKNANSSATLPPHVPGMLPPN